MITARTLREAARGDRDLLSSLKGWLKVVKRERWKNLVELKRSMPEADYVRPYVVFNILNNRFRLIARVKYARPKPDGELSEGRVYIKRLLTHQEYNNRDNWK